MPDPTADHRPSPEALLKEAQQGSRGRLKIFLGASPGVGKTYEMLQAARKKLRDGVRVLVGIVETHGRRETQALLEGLPILPRRQLPHRDRTLEELDLDALLAQRPQLALVDELAHSNAPGSRHPKRYHDVEELLSAGIDVYTTLNVQHLESLNDVIAQITRVRVRETVPDSVLETADEIELIDIAPDELIERLREGKVYHGEAGERALRNYFTPENLTALRELALRSAAAQVDEKLRLHRRARGVQDVWAAGERVLVCVDESASAAQLVRHAKRVADALDAPWDAVHFETARSTHLGEAARDRIAGTLRLADSLGAEIHTLPGARITDDILRYAREHNVTQIVLGKARRSPWFEFLHGSVVDDLVRKARNITVQVIAEEGGAPPPPRRLLDFFDIEEWPGPRALIAPVFYVTLATLIAWPMDRFGRIENISLVFLLAVLITATRFGLLPALLAALLGSLVYNFFFLEPYYTFTITDPNNIFAFVFFVLVAALVSQLTARERSQQIVARNQAQTTSLLLNLSRRLASATTLEQLLQITAFETSQLLKVEAICLAPVAEELKIMGAMPLKAEIDEADRAAAHWGWSKGRPAGRGSDTLPGARCLFVPLRASGGTQGVIGVRGADPDFQLAPDARRLLETIADLAAISTERMRMAKDIDQARSLAKTEKLRAALLSSISHDLRTPLAGILGAITSLKSYGEKFDAKAQRELLDTAQDETERMSRFVSNLLDMTRLDGGALTPKREPCDLGEIVASALRRAQRLLSKHRVAMQVPRDLPMVQLDYVLMEQVLLNLLDNAAKYAPEGSSIELAARLDAGAIRLEVRDEGPGIPVEDLPRIFDFFYRAQQADRSNTGAGLGLAISRGFVQAMGGRMHCRNRPRKEGKPAGAVFEVELPASLVVHSAPAA